MADKKPLCKYGEKCYRKNPGHLADFRHPNAAEEDDDSKADDATANIEAASTIASVSPADSSTAVASTNVETSTKAGERRSHDQIKDDDVQATPAVDVSQKTATDEPACKKPTLVSPRAPQQCFDSDNDQTLRDEYARLIVDRPAFIRDKFLVTMPADFYAFWDFCSLENPAAPLDALKELQLRLVGPFDVLAGRFDGITPREPAEYLRHWRFFYDPPEFQTVLVCTGKRDGLHYGYWRDDPQCTYDEPANTANAATANVLMAQTDCDQGCAVQLVAENIFTAVIRHIDNMAMTPFLKSHAVAVRQKLLSFGRSAGVRVMEPPDAMATRLRSRNASVVTRTFHTAGLVLQIDRQTQVGYRPLLETPQALRKILTRLDDVEDGSDDAVVALVMEKLQPMVTAANIAVDESDFGTAIELGVNFFCHGSHRLHGLAMQLLVTGYTMVRRPQLLAIVKAHLSKRQHGKNMSIL